MGDSLRWKWESKTTLFSVKSCYEKWELEFNPQCKLIWKNICPFKVEVFLWQALEDKIATGAELVKRNVLNPENGDLGLCPFCNQELETVAHLFLHCPKTWKVW